VAPRGELCKLHMGEVIPWGMVTLCLTLRVYNLSEVTTFGVYEILKAFNLK
jgi:hypothetical protein